MNRYEFKYIEIELKRIAEYKKRIELLEMKYIDKGKQITNALYRHYSKIKRIQVCSEEALQELSCLHKLFYELYFVKNKSLQRVAIDLNLTPYTVEKLRKEIIEKVGEKLGFVEEKSFSIPIRD